MADKPELKITEDEDGNLKLVMSRQLWDRDPAGGMIDAKQKFRAYKLPAGCSLNGVSITTSETEKTLVCLVDRPRAGPPTPRDT